MNVIIYTIRLLYYINNVELYKLSSDAPDNRKRNYYYFNLHYYVR
jgi:hypothetical protein